jgi:hypothetical protein
VYRYVTERAPTRALRSKTNAINISQPASSAAGPLYKPNPVESYRLKPPGLNPRAL